ncbi:MAG TPA: serine hydrolase domain-containing protein [Acidimicrobiales bacterium]|nr:serine hydrolase domain-containing protein [Acidimicrobiales bacterium]
MASALATIDAWPRPHAAAVLVEGEIVDDRGDVEVELPWASVTKVATALATHVAVAGGYLRLDDAAGPPGSTVRHLLAHASGLAFDRAEVRAAPGARRIYSNAGYEVLAGVVATAVGRPFAAWLEESVLAPLGMGRSRLVGSAAAGLLGPLADLVGLAEELQRPSLLPAPSAALLRDVAFPGLAGLLPGLGHQVANDWALGPEVRDHKAPHWTGARNDPSTFGHFGASGSFIWVDPAAGVACACATGAPFGDWARAAWPALADAVLAEWSSGTGPS